MKHAAAILLAFLLTACGHTERVDISTVTENMAAHMEALVRLEGTRVKRNPYITMITLGTQNYFVLEDSSGKIRVWYNTLQHRCPPRLGAQVVVEGKVVETKNAKQKLFVARSISIESEPPLADDEIRACQLSHAESEIYQTQGLERLWARWRAQGKPARKVITD